MGAESLALHELERIYYWLNRQRLMEWRNLSSSSLRDLEECERRVQELMLATRAEAVLRAAGGNHG